MLLWRYVSPGAGPLPFPIGGRLGCFPIIYMYIERAFPSYVSHDSYISLLMKFKTCLLTLLFLLPAFTASLGEGGLRFRDGHPRYLTDASGKEATWTLIHEQPWAADVFRQLQERTDAYVARGPEWLTSRLQMYWKTHATEVYIRGEYFDHAGGEKAPCPTVMYTGARSNATDYVRPRLDELTPYAEDERGLWLAPKRDPEKREWVRIDKTGTMIQSINVEILGIARDAAFLWWMTGEEGYAQLAGSVFDTYMTGIYYRNVPQDLNHGHQQTLVGMTTFEVIHEDALKALVPLYDFLYGYLQQTKPEKMDIYAGAFKKWADNIVANGVPHNNWNLIEARFLLDIALILEDDADYPDGKGRGFYTDCVLNRSSIRQWSLRDLAAYGFDGQTGIWAEAPGYASVVVGDFADFASLMARNLDYDLLGLLPVVPRAVEAMPQYLFPNRMMVGFGDTHPGYLRTDIFSRMVENAQRYGKKEQERRFTALWRLFDPEKVAALSEKSGGTQGENLRMPVAVTSFFTEKPLQLDGTIPAASIDSCVTPTFYAPNVSWVVQRNGMDPQRSLMVSLSGSDGNHMHANGIGMELYGRGYVLAPDAGIGLTLYSGLDYLEYYSQFPAHNTVCVDGVSSYPIMKSNHAFRLSGCFPEPGSRRANYAAVSYSEVDFREPETQSDQRRLLSIVAAPDSLGYYVDIFRSRRTDGKDKMHDYFYHNLGQTMTLTASDGSDLGLAPTEELAFAGAHLYAYSYLFDKKKADTSADVRSDFTIRMPDADDITMTLWMKGYESRSVFSALSPMTEGLSRIREMPYNIKEQPTLTFVARQKGEAWTRPFVALFEPSSVQMPGSIRSVDFPAVESDGAESAVGIRVTHKKGRVDRILSTDNPASLCTMEGMKAKAAYALWVGPAEQDGCILFLGSGTWLEVPGVRVEAAELCDVLLERRNGKWYYSASKPCLAQLDGHEFRLEAAMEPRPVVAD